MGGTDPLKIGRFQVHHFSSLTSTQTEAKQSGYGPGCVVLADEQTASYGRRGRAWQSPKGNLCCTLIEAWTGYDDLAWLPYALGLALHDALSGMLKDGHDLRLKWPNDILLNGDKLCGILLEIEDDRVLIGIGMNIVAAPETDQKTVALNDHAIRPMQPIDVIKAFLPAYEKWCQQARAQGFPALRDEWLDRAAFAGQQITARLANGTVLTGEFQGLNGQGALVLQGENGHHVVTAADIYLKKDQDKTNEQDCSTR